MVKIIALPLFVAVDDEVQGPFLAAELSQLWRAGELDSNARYWHRGMPAWVPVSEFVAPAHGMKIDPSIVRITTTHDIVGRPIVEQLDVISAEHVFAQGLLATLATGTLAGGTREGDLRKARRECLAGLREEAASIGADGVVGVHLNYTTMSDVRGGFAMLVATGTAVALGPPPLR